MFPLNCEGDKMTHMRLWTSSTINQLRAHSHIQIYPKITNFAESKFFTRNDIGNLNMEK